MNKYLIFINVGEVMECPDCSYMHHYICEGKTEEEAIIDWYNKVVEVTASKYADYEPSKPNIKQRNGIWYESGYQLQVIHLKDSEGYDKDGYYPNWKELKWV